MVRLPRPLALAAALVAPLAGPSAADSARYVAMGDSYSSGVGTREYYAGSGACRRSPHAYPAEVAARLSLSLAFLACSGADTADVLSRQVSGLDRITSRVTISVGGNDAGFGHVLSSCARPWPWTCRGEIADAEALIRTTLPARLDAVYSAIRARAPAAVVTVVGYPRVFNGRNVCNAAARISPGEQAALNETADLLAGVIRARAQAHGFSYVDPIPSFAGHAACDPAAWINGLSNPIWESYHPNRAGHDAYRDLVLRTFG